MEPLKNQNFFEKYEYLQNLLKHYTNPIDRNNMNMKEYLILIHRIILKHSENSDKKMVGQVEDLFSILVQNSVRMDNNTILFKTLTNFIQNGFDLFVKTLKSKEVISKEKFFKHLLNILDSKKIAESFNLNEKDIENQLNISVLKTVIMNIKSKFVNKIFSLSLFFLHIFIHENDTIIKNQINKYICEEYFNKFYQNFDERKKCNIWKDIINSE